MYVFEDSEDIWMYAISHDFSKLGYDILIVAEFEIDERQSFLGAIDRYRYHQSVRGFYWATLNHPEIVSIAVFLLWLIFALEKYTALTKFAEKRVASEWEFEDFCCLRD